MKAAASVTVGGAMLVLLGSCVEAQAQSAQQQGRSPQPAAIPVLTGDFGLRGQRMQGALLRGRVPAGTVTLTLDGVPVAMAADGAFVAGLDRDAKPVAQLVATLADGRRLTQTLSVAPRGWDISRLTSLPKFPVPAPEFARLRPPELAQISAARKIVTDAQGWRQDFLWPAIGRISTRFGSQRVYANGEAGSYHSGIDIAKPVGATVLAPADGVVVLATDRPFSLEGYLLLIDHGAGVSSSFLHLSRIDVRVGDRVRKGQPVAAIGATGRVTGPHLHWTIRWREAKIDPLLVVGPMPGG